MDELRWIVGLNIVLAVWLGMLADTWKGRRMYVWMLIGFLTSMLGVALLIALPKVTRQSTSPSRESAYGSLDSYGHEGGR